MDPNQTVGGLCWCGLPIAHVGECQMFAGQKPSTGTVGGLCWCRLPIGHVGPCQMFAGLPAAKAADAESDKETIAALRSQLASAQTLVKLIGTVTPCSNCDGSGKNAQGDCCRIPGHARECKCLLCQWKDACYRNENDCVNAKCELASAVEAQKTTETLILEAHHRALPANWTYTDSRTTLDILVAEITTLRVERDQAIEAREKAERERDKARAEVQRLTQTLATKELELTVAAQDVRVMYEKLDDANAIIAGLKAGIAEAPHGPLCRKYQCACGMSDNRQLCTVCECNCWKSSSTAAEEGRKLLALEASEQRMRAAIGKALADLNGAGPQTAYSVAVLNVGNAVKTLCAALHPAAQPSSDAPPVAEKETA